MSPDETSRHRRPSRYASNSGPPPRRRRRSVTAASTASSATATSRSCPDLAGYSNTIEPFSMCDVPLLDRGKPVTAVVVGVLLAADPEEPEVEQPEGRAQGPFTRHAREREVIGDDGASTRQAGGELQHPFELRLVTSLAPCRVVEVLPSTSVVGTGRLEVTVGERADPDVPPRRWNRQRLAPRDIVLGERATRFVDVGEPASASAAGPTRPARRDAAQTGHGAHDGEAETA